MKTVLLKLLVLFSPFAFYAQDTTGATTSGIPTNVIEIAFNEVVSRADFMPNYQAVDKESLSVSTADASNVVAGNYAATSNVSFVLKPNGEAAFNITNVSNSPDINYKWAMVTSNGSPFVVYEDDAVKKYQILLYELNTLDGGYLAELWVGKTKVPTFFAIFMAGIEQQVVFYKTDSFANGTTLETYDNTLLYPNPGDLEKSIANRYYRLGDMDKFKSFTLKAMQLAPNDATLPFNLGVVAADTGNPTIAKIYYKKAIDIEPRYENAYINITALILSEEGAMVEEMNSLGTTADDDKRYDELLQLRTGIYLEASTYLETLLTHNPNNLPAANTLMNIYKALNKTDKFEAMKQHVASIQAKN